MYITKKQKEVFDFLKDYISLNGYAPTFDEIADYFQFSSKGTVYKYIKILEKKGLIRHDWNRTRSIEITPDVGENLSVLPVLGLVSAGKPIQAIEDVEHLEVPANFLKRGEHYILKVVGDSMIEEHIKDGDFVVIQKRKHAENGETVVALLDNEEVTIKKFFRKNGQVELHPANPSLDKIVVDPNRVQIQGVVVGVLRKY